MDPRTVEISHPWRQKNEQGLPLPRKLPAAFHRPIHRLIRLLGLASSKEASSTTRNGAAEEEGRHPMSNWGRSALLNSSPRLPVCMQSRSKPTKCLRQLSTPSAIRPLLTQLHGVKKTRSATMHYGCVAIQRAVIPYMSHDGVFVSCLNFSFLLCVHTLLANRTLSELKQLTTLLRMPLSSYTCLVLSSSLFHKCLLRRRLSRLSTTWRFFV